MQRGRAPRREQNNRVVFERLWRGTFQAVLAGPQRRPRASSHDPNPDSGAMPAIAPQQGPSAVDPLEPALRTILQGLRSSCCCRCNCLVTERNNYNNNLQVCLANGEERKSMRSVISVRETHAVAEAQQEKNARLRDAFGISPRFVEGTSFDPEKRAREHAERYPLVRTPSQERDDRSTHAVKKKKKRSVTPETKKLKKKKSKKNKKEKQESSKKKKKRSKSSDTDSSSSSEAAQDSDSSSSADERQKKKKKKKSSSRRRDSTEPSSRESSPIKYTKERQRSVEDRNNVKFRKEPKDRDHEDRNRNYDKPPHKDSKQRQSSRRREDRSVSRVKCDSSPEHRHRSYITKVENKRYETSRDDERPRGEKRHRRESSNICSPEPPSKNKPEKRSRKQNQREDSSTPPPEKKRRKSVSPDYRKQEDSYYNNRKDIRDNNRNHRENSLQNARKAARRIESPEYRKGRVEESYSRRERNSKCEKTTKSNQDRYEKMSNRRDKENHDDQVKRRKNKSLLIDDREESPEQKSSSSKPYRSKDSRKDTGKSIKNTRQERKYSSSESDSESQPKQRPEKSSKNKAQYYTEREPSPPPREQRKHSSSPEYKRKESPTRNKPEKYRRSIENKRESSRPIRNSPSPEKRLRRRTSLSRSKSLTPRKSSKRDKLKCDTPITKSKKSSERRTPSPRTDHEDRRGNKEKSHERRDFHENRSRSRSHQRSTSSLSYSPARRSPERYREIIEKLPEKDKRKYIKSPSDLVPKKKKNKELAKNYKPKAVCMRSSSSEDEPEDDFLRLDERDRPDDMHLKDFDINALKQQLVQMAKESIELKRNEDTNVPSTSHDVHSDFKLQEDDKPKSSVGPAVKEKEKSPQLERKSPPKGQIPKKVSPAHVHLKSSPELKKRSRSASRRSWSRSSSRRSRSKSRSRGKSSRSRSRSRSGSRSTRSRSRSYSSSRRSRSSRSSSYSSRSSSRSSRSSSRSTRSSRTMTGVYADYRRSSESRPRTRTRSRSPSIPRRAGSPSFLERRRITSARKRPIPYRRPTPSTPTTGSYYSSRSSQRSWSRSPREDRE